MNVATRFGGRGKIGLIAFIFLALLTADSAAATAWPGGDARASAGVSAISLRLQSESGYQPQRRYVLRPLYSLEGHLHNKLIHLPIGFGLAAMFLSVLSLRWPEYQPGVRWLVLVAAIGAVAAIMTGLNQAVALEGGSKDWVIDIHRTLGITTACFLWIWSASFWIRPLRRWSVYVGLLTTLLIVVTGFFGGVIAHG